MRRLALCLCALVAGGATAAAAQTDPRLVAAVRSAQEGQGDSARSAVERLLAATAPTDPLYPEILYTQAMVANTAADVRRHLQRVSVEHPTSPWADDALLRLVQLDYATRSFDAAARNLERLRLDHPVTPLLAQAGYWGGRTYFELKDTTRACRWLADGIAAAQTDVELQRQLGFLYQRCGTAGRGAVATGDTAGAGQRTATAPIRRGPRRPLPRPRQRLRLPGPRIQSQPGPPTRPPRGWRTRCPSGRPRRRPGSGCRSRPSRRRAPPTTRRARRRSSVFPR